MRLTVEVEFGGRSWTVPLDQINRATPDRSGDRTKVVFGGGFEGTVTGDGEALVLGSIVDLPAGSRLYHVWDDGSDSEAALAAVHWNGLASVVTASGLVPPTSDIGGMRVLFVPPGTIYADGLAWGLRPGETPEATAAAMLARRRHLDREAAARRPAVVE